MFDPVTNSEVRVFWQPVESSTVLGQIVSVRIQTPIGLVAPEVPHGAIKSIVETADEVVITLKKGPSVIVEPKPAPPAPRIWDFVPDYVAIMSKLKLGDLSVLPAFFELQGRVTAAGFTMGSVAAAAGGK